ncbi:MAG: hypothetical protein ACRDDH_20130 [Cetobacterium sp.]|uniref:hypothetical protein n=1 Tax=Cetobacterium sp. TaxID=2071632 RepID=UPI003EE5BA53
MAVFSDTEDYILKLFRNQQILKLKSGAYKILNVGKPQPSDGKGEGKTDVYVELESPNKTKEELKISIKQNNADFLENKISLIRAKQILGEDATDIIKESIEKIEDKFKSPLVFISKFKRTEAGVITIGWKFELTNKINGAKSSKLLLTNEQKLDIYSGSNLSIEKRNCKVNGSIIENSGVANFLLEVDTEHMPKSAEEVYDSLELIEKYVKEKDIYFACKAINYRTSKSKWDGDRPLAVYIDWSLKNGRLCCKVISDEPLEKKANEIGNNIKEILKELGLNSKNFKDIKKYVDNKKIIND